MENKKSNINKDFNIAQKAEEEQKRRSEQERHLRIEQIRDEAVKQRLERMMQTRDAETQRDINAKVAEQEKALRDETQKRLDAQKAPSLDHPVGKTLLGQSPQDVANKVEADFKAMHENELAGFADGQRQVFNKIIDQKIEAAWKQQVEQDRQNHAEQSFEKAALKSPESSKDAFQKAHDQKGGEKDWRSLKADREAEAKKDRER